jgi:hypothetical protein
MEKEPRFTAWVLGSAGLMVLGAFGPWVKALGQSVSGTDGSNDGWLVIAAAAFGGLLFYLARRTSRGAGVWAILGGAAGVAITLYDRQHIQHAIDQGGAFAAALASVGWGLNLALAASASLGIAGLVWQMGMERTQPAIPEAPPLPLAPPIAPPD